MNEKSEIEKAVKYQLSNYPESRLTDIYKSFFQDFYGPGHLLENPEGAIDYLRKEIEMVTACSQENPVEATGYKGRFVRVDLCLVKQGKISFEEFSELFLESGKSFQLPDIEEWKLEWLKILSVIEEMGIDIVEFEKDRKFLGELLENGDYVVHHSKEYIMEYGPHYRLIHKDLMKGLDY